MDVVKLWNNLLANCAIGSSVCSIPTAYFVQGTTDVQFFGDFTNINESSIVDSDSENSYTGVNDNGPVGTIEEGEDEDDEEEDVGHEVQQQLFPVMVVHEIEEGSECGKGYDCDRDDEVKVSSSVRENVDKCKKQTQGKQTQTKIHRNRYSREEYRCSMCPYTCTTEKAFLKHSRSCEPKDENDSDNKYLNLSCPICGKDRNGEVSLVLHMKKHKDNKHFCCDICKFKTLQLKKLIQHRRMHTGEKPHLCPFCSYRSARRDNLRSHARRVHKKDNLPCDTFTPRSMILTPSKSKLPDQ